MDETKLSDMAYETKKRDLYVWPWHFTPDTLWWNHLEVDWIMQLYDSSFIVDSSLSELSLEKMFHRVVLIKARQTRIIEK